MTIAHLAANYERLTMNIEQARFNMIEQQIRPWNVLNQHVLDLLAQTPREIFVPESFRSLAFSDANIPIGHGQTMMSPKMEARLLQSLDVQAGDEALEVGTGSGYLTALLARSCKHVLSVEIIGELSQQAGGTLTRQGITNLALEVGDGVRGWPQCAPYDVIAVTGSVYRLDTHLQQQLRIGGRLFAIVGEEPVMEARLITRVDEDEWSNEDLFETSLAPLIGAEPPKRFIL